MQPMVPPEPIPSEYTKVQMRTPSSTNTSPPSPLGLDASLSLSVLDTTSRVLAGFDHGADQLGSSSPLLHGEKRQRTEAFMQDMAVPRVRVRVKIRVKVRFQSTSIITKRALMPFHPRSSQRSVRVRVGVRVRVKGRALP